MAAVSAVYALFLWTIPLPRTWVSLTAKSQLVVYRPANSNFAAFRIGGMRGATTDGRFSGCLDGILAPSENSRVEYRRGGEDFFRITIDPPGPGGVAASFRDRSKGYAASDLTGSLVASLSPNCPGKPPTTLPVWGPAEYGEEQRPAGVSGDLVPGMLTEGTIAVYAHAHDRIMGLRFPATIYAVTTFDLPAGAVLSSGDSGSDQSAWTGTATAGDDAGFDIRTSSNTHEVQLRSTRVLSSAQTTSRTIDLGDYAQFLSDPNIVQIQFVAGAFMFIVQMMLSVLNFLEWNFLVEEEEESE